MSLPTTEFDRLFKKMEETNRKLDDIKRNVAIGFIFIGLAVYVIALGVMNCLLLLTLR